jgi:hypothetical protein
LQFSKRGDNDKFSLFEMGFLPAGKYYSYIDPNEDAANTEPDVNLETVESNKPEYITNTKKSNEDNNSGEPVEFLIRDEYRYEIGWCGQNAAEAVALIADYIKNEDKGSLEKGIAVLDTWAKYAPLESGLFRVVFDDIIAVDAINGNDKDYKYEFEIDTCNLGWGMWQMLEAYQLLKSINIDKPEYFKMAIDTCDFFVANKADDGSFGKSWSADGKLENESGTIGCFILLGLVKAYEITGEEKYLNTTKEMYKFYVERDLNKCECSAGALDTECIDKETCWPLCKIGIDLYEITGDEQYLDDAIHAAYYLLTFTFHYNAIYGPETDFSKHGYMTYGGTSVSTQHHHLDPWGSLICYDIYRLFEITGDEKWKIRFEALWRNAILCTGDGKLKIHGLLRQKSAQNEAFLQCRFTFGEKQKPGRLNDWILSWPGAFKLITMMRAKDDDLFK